MFSDLKFLFEEKLSEKEIILTIPEYDSELFVEGDKTALLHDVLANLVSNAIKFSPNHSKIEISTVELSNSRVKIGIRDYGIGIPEYLANVLFDSTAQTSRVGTNGESGTGFGLPLVKEYVNALGGEIRLCSSSEEQSSEKSGSCFEIILNKSVTI